MRHRRQIRTCRGRIWPPRGRPSSMERDAPPPPDPPTLGPDPASPCATVAGSARAVAGSGGGGRGVPLDLVEAVDPPPCHGSHREREGGAPPHRETEGERHHARRGRGGRALGEGGGGRRLDGRGRGEGTALSGEESRALEERRAARSRGMRRARQGGRGEGRECWREMEKP